MIRAEANRTCWGVISCESGDLIFAARTEEEAREMARDAWEPSAVKPIKWRLAVPSVEVPKEFWEICGESISKLLQLIDAEKEDGGDRAMLEVVQCAVRKTAEVRREDLTAIVEDFRIMLLAKDIEDGRPPTP